MKSLIFSNQHVEMILSGRKTMTRRLVKPPVSGYLNAAKCLSGHQHEAEAYARPGDRIVVRERFWKSSSGSIYFREPSYLGGPPPPYVAKACSPLHLPWKESRCTIEVVSCRVERLLDMPAEDVAKEGYPGTDPDPFFVCVWDKLNPKAPASTNPWVYVVEFRMLKGRWD